MKTAFASIFLLIISSLSAQKNWPEHFNMKDELLSTTADRYEGFSVFYPYIMSAPFDDSTSNLYIHQAVIDNFNSLAVKMAKAKINPEDLRPVTTAERLNRFFFIVDLPSMSQQQRDSCQQFLKYFHSQLQKGESMEIFRWNDNRTFSVAAQPIFEVPSLELKDVTIWNKRSFEPKYDAHIRKHDLSWAIDNLTAERAQTSTTYDFGPGKSQDNIYVYIGNSANYSGARSELVMLNGAMRARCKYLAYVDFNSSKNPNDFREMASYAGGQALPVSWSFENVTECLLTRLVQYYEVKKKGNYSDEIDLYPTPWMEGVKWPPFPMR